MDFHPKADIFPAGEKRPARHKRGIIRLSRKHESNCLISTKLILTVVIAALIIAVILITLIVTANTVKQTQDFHISCFFFRFVYLTFPFFIVPDNTAVLRIS